MFKLLVVDDEQAFVTLVATWFSMRDCQVLEANNASDALRIAQQEQPDVVLLDVMMPGMDGIQACKELRENPSTSHIPVVLVTAHNPLVGRGQALLAGAADYVIKPVALEELWERLRGLLGQGVGPADQGKRLLQETVHSALSILSCNLVWLLILEPNRRALISEAVATSRPGTAAARFGEMVSSGPDNLVIELSQEKDPLAKVALSGVAEFNIPLSELRARVAPYVYRAWEFLDLYFVSIVPLHHLGTPLGVLVIGSREPHDVETTKGYQRIVSVANQAATVVQNVRLITRLAAREEQNRLEREFYQRLLDRMGHAVLTYDGAQTIRFTNRRLSIMTGLTAEALEGLPVVSLFHPDDEETVQGMLKASRDRQTASFELRLKGPAGEPTPVLTVQAGRPVIQDGNGSDQYLLALTDLTDQKRRERMLREQTRRLQAVNRASLAISSIQTLDESITTLLEETRAVLDLSAAFIMLLSDDRATLEMRSIVGPLTEQFHFLQVPVDNSILGSVVLNGKVEIVENLYEDDRFFREVDQKYGVAASSLAAAPLVYHGNAIGVLVGVNKHDGSFDEYDREILEALARSAALAFENTQLYGESQRRIAELSLLLRVSEAAASPLELQQVVERVTQYLSSTLKVAWCSVSTWQRANNALSDLATIAELLPAEGNAKPRWNEPPGVLRSVLKETRPQRTSLEALGLPDQEYEYITRLGGLTAVVLPILIDGQVAGLVEVIYPAPLDQLASELERAQVALVTALHAADSDVPWHEDASCLRGIGERLLVEEALWCVVTRVDPESQKGWIVYQHVRALFPLDRGPVDTPDETSLRRVALMERNPLSLHLDSPVLSEADKGMLPVRSGTLAVLPVLARGEAVGLIQLVDLNSSREFTDDELSLAQAIANILGTALSNARLYTTLLRRAAQLEAAYNDLRDADRIKAEWIQNVSHELRTPLATIVGYVELMLEGDLGPLTEDQERGLTNMSRKAQSLTQLVENILALQDMMETPVQREKTLLADVVADTVNLMRQRAAQLDIHIAVECSDDIPPIIADASRLHRALESLIDNALKFSPQGSVIQVIVRDEPQSQYVEVRDPGIGIPKDEHQKIWQSFYQVDGSMTRRYGGTGLGLAIVKQVIDQHGGKVWVESEPGEGSRFCFSLPKQGITQNARQPHRLHQEG